MPRRPETNIGKCHIGERISVIWCSMASNHRMLLGHNWLLWFLSYQHPERSPSTYTTWEVFRVPIPPERFFQGPIPPNCSLLFPLARNGFPIPVSYSEIRFVCLSPYSVVALSVPLFFVPVSWPDNSSRFSILWRPLRGLSRDLYAERFPGTYTTWEFYCLCRTSYLRGPHCLYGQVVYRCQPTWRNVLSERWYLVVTVKYPSGWNTLPASMIPMSIFMKRFRETWGKDREVNRGWPRRSQKITSRLVKRYACGFPKCRRGFPVS